MRKRIIVFILFILGTLFYWYSIRPSKIKQQCFAEAEFDKRTMFEMSDTKRHEFTEMYYSECLMRFGLK